MAGYILHNNLFRSATIVSEDTQSGFGISNAFDGFSSTLVSFASGAMRAVILDFGSAAALSAFAYGRNNFSTRSATIAVYGSNTSNSGPWTLITLNTPTNNNVYCTTFEEVSYRYIQIQMTGLTGTASCADIALGPKLFIPTHIGDGLFAPEHSDNDRLISNKTVGQNLVGLTRVEMMATTTMQLKMVDPDWFSNNWDAFRSSAKQYPFYWVWKTGEQAFYGWPVGKIGQVRYEKNIFQGITLKLEGFSA